MTLDAQVQGKVLSFRVRAAPGAKREGITGAMAGAVKVAVQAPAEDGRANERILRVLADALDVSLRHVRLASGARSRDKVVTIEAADPAEILTRLRALCGA
ncbi:MAG: DUF167 domain-containing protein [Planctomycetota bacterium]